MQQTSRPAPGNHDLVMLLTCILILLGAAFLYAHDVEMRSFWLDESWSAVAVTGSPTAVWQFAATEGVHPPLHYMALWGYVRLIGDSEFALRWFSGLVALVGLALTYRLAADWYGPLAGRYAMLLTAGSLFLMYAAREARHYTTFFALATAVIWAYDRWQRRPNRKRWLALVFLQAALLYTHVFGVWMAVVIGFHALITNPGKRRWAVLAALALSGLLFLAWLPALIYQYSHAPRGAGYAIQDTGAALLGTLDRFFAGFNTIGMLALILSLIAIWQYWQKRRMGLLVIWLILPLALILAVNLIYPWFIRRIMIFTLAAVTITLGAGLAALASRYRWGRWIAALLALGFVGVGIIRFDTFNPDVGLPDWRSIANAVSWDCQPADVMVVAGEPYSMTYYLRRFLPDPPPVISLDDWLAHTGTPKRVWLTSMQQAVAFEAIDALPAGMTQTRRYVLGNLVTEFYQATPTAVQTVFADQMALGISHAPDYSASPGEIVYLNLWWQPGSIQPQADYSAGVYVMGADGRLWTQNDGGIDAGRINAPMLPREQWTPDARMLTLPPDIPAGSYDVMVAVYDWQTGDRLPSPDTGEDRLFRIAQITVVD